MQLNKSRDVCWDPPGYEAWMVTQRYKGQKVAAMTLISKELPRSGRAFALMTIRKKVRAIIGRTDRKLRRANLRSQS